MDSTIAIDDARLVYEGALCSESAAISVVIPSHRVGVSLGHCLRAFLEQTLARNYFEIVLILDGVSADEGLMAVAARLPIRIYSLAESRGRGHARNVGLRHSKGALIVSLDGDMVASPNLLSSYLEQHRQGSFACVGLRKFAMPAEETVGGQIFTDFATRCLDRPDYRDVFYYQTEFLKTAAEPFWAFSTCNCSYPRALANHIGGFDEKMRGWGLEDQEFGYRLWQSGNVQFVYLERALAIHVEHARNMAEQENTWLENLSYLKRKHGEIFTDPRRSVRAPARMPQVLIENSRMHDKAWRTAPSYRFSFGLKSNAAWSADTGRLFPVSATDTQVLGFSTVFRSIEEHAKNAIRRAPALFNDDLQAAMACLIRLREAGGLISQEEILAACRRQAQKPQEAPQLEWLTIPTRGDSVSVVRALHSYIDNAQYFKHSPRFFIADDSVSPEDRSGIQIALSGITKDRPVRIVYAGEEEKYAFSLRLIDKGIPASVVHLAIFGFGDGSIRTGANRNAISLATAGSLILTIDDDTICNTGKAYTGMANNKLVIEGEGEFQEFCHFADRQAALDSVEFEMIDFVGSHAQLLGQSLPSIVVSATDSEDPPDWDRMCPHMLNWLMQGTGQIVLTSSGAVGDSGMHSRIPFLANRNASLMRFEKSEGDYARVSQSREIIRQSRARIVGHTLFFQTMFAGLDNRIPLPPFFPGYRNQDSVFAKTLSVCVEGACIGHIPMVLEHSPNVTRIHADGTVGRIRVCNLVIACMALWRPRSDEEKVEDRIRSLGKHLEFLGHSPLKDFKAAVYPPLLAEISAFVTNAQELLRSANGQPEYWARDLTRQLDTISARVFDPEFLQPLDLPATISPADALVHVQRLVRDFGRLLQWWPAMLEGSRELAHSGKGLGRELNCS